MLILLHLLFPFIFFSNNVSMPFFQLHFILFSEGDIIHFCSVLKCFSFWTFQCDFCFHSVIVNQFHLFTNPSQFTYFLILLCFSFFFFELFETLKFLFSLFFGYLNHTYSLFIYNEWFCSVFTTYYTFHDFNCFSCEETYIVSLYLFLLWLLIFKWEYFFFFSWTRWFLKLFLFICLLKDNCFTEFCCFLSSINMNQP